MLYVCCIEAYSESLQISACDPMPDFLGLLTLRNTTSQLASRNEHIVYTTLVTGWEARVEYQELGLDAANDVHLISYVLGI